MRRRPLLAVAILVTLAAGCGRVVRVLPGPTVVVTETRTAGPTIAVLPVLTPARGAGAVVSGRHQGLGSSPVFATVTLSGSQLLTITAVCRGGGTLAVLAASGISSRSDTVSCDGRVRRTQFAAYDFFGYATVSVEALANQSWATLLQRG